MVQDHLFPEQFYILQWISAKTSHRQHFQFQGLDSNIFSDQNCPTPVRKYEFSYQE